MVLVRATSASARNNIRIRELRRVASPGEEFEVSESRLEILSGRNKYHLVFVIPVPVDKEDEEAPKKRSKKTEK